MSIITQDTALSLLFEEVWGSEDYADNVDLRNALSEFIDATDEFYQHAERVHSTKVGTDDFWYQDALDTLSRKRTALRHELWRCA